MVASGSTAQMSDAVCIRAEQAGSRAEEAMAPGKAVPHPRQQVTITVWPGCLEAMDKYSASLIHSQEAIMLC